MDLTSYIQAIHNSDLYGVIIETGCGVPVANRLFEIDGASKTVYLTESPYSEAYGTDKYGKTERCVSSEYVDKILNYWGTCPRINMVYVASFQIGTDTSILPSKITHGWIGIMRDSHKELYHITLRKVSSRKSTIDKIGEIGIQLLWESINPMVNHISNINVDIAPHIQRTLILRSNDNVVCFEPDGSMKRMEDIFRSQTTKQVVIYKGSFNPPTKAHFDLMQSTCQRYPECLCAFMISVQTCDKKTVTDNDLQQRIQWINLLGYRCLVNDDGTFRWVADFFSTYFPRLRLVCPVGQDTKNRITDFVNLSNVITFEIFPRTEISSTQVRKAIDEDDWETVNKMVPPIIYDHLIQKSSHKVT
jgi:nicotinic acid mononucleotide adenylyltransferase